MPDTTTTTTNQPEAWIDRMFQNARAIIEDKHQEHMPMVLLKTTETIVPIGIAGGEKDDMYAAIDAAVAFYKPELGIFIDEAWASDAENCPQELMLACAEGRLRVSELPLQYRTEILMMYAEDLAGHWAYKSWRIKERQPGGLQFYQSSTSESPPQADYTNRMSGRLTQRLTRNQHRQGG